MNIIRKLFDKLDDLLYSLDLIRPDDQEDDWDEFGEEASV